MSFVNAKDNKNSSMRLNFIMAAIAGTFLLVCVGVFIIVKAFKESSIDWSGMGVFCGLVLGGLTGMGFAKAQQKKWEISGEVDIERIDKESQFQRENKGEFR
jgi:hypothetical protein